MFDFGAVVIPRWVLKPFVVTPKKVLGLLLSFLVRKHDLVCATTHFHHLTNVSPYLLLVVPGIIAIQSKKCVR